MGHILFLKVIVFSYFDLHVPVVVLDAALAVLVETLSHIVRVIVDRSTDLAKKGLVLNALEQIWRYKSIIGFI